MLEKNSIAGYVEQGQRNKVEIFALILEMANINSGNSNRVSDAQILLKDLVDINQGEDLSTLQNKGFTEYSEAQHTRTRTNMMTTGRK
jgi:hypothetical protein